ncbi:hypothetical protein RGU73_27620 [Neobacillus cucumis]|nr:hypothetical protein [Neobacillus cucumis]MDR4950057.1 hypothetical protein [Neobacillus cucumis]
MFVKDAADLITTDDFDAFLGFSLVFGDRRNRKDAFLLAKLCNRIWVAFDGKTI